MKGKDLKLMVTEKYEAIAKQSVLSNHSSCCGNSGCCGELEFNMIGYEYNSIKDHNPDADLGLGCGIPTEFAFIKKGDIVIDLGIVANCDVFCCQLHKN